MPAENRHGAELFLIFESSSVLMVVLSRIYESEKDIIHDPMLCILEHGLRLVILLAIIKLWTHDLSRNGIAYGSRIAAASFPAQ